jgi:hypothetical protein
MAEDLDVFNIELTDDEMNRIAAMDTGVGITCLLGSSGPQVSAIGPRPHEAQPRQRPGHRDGIALIRAAVDQGVTFFDPTPAAVTLV